MPKPIPNNCRFGPSHGGTDEGVQFCVVRAHATQAQINALDGTRAGAADEDEHTYVHMVVLRTQALGYLWRYGPPSLKTITSLLLYERAGRLW